MADIAISLALVLVEKVLPSFDKESKLQKNVYDGVQDIRNLLETVQAYLRDMDRKEERSEVLKDRVKKVRDLAYDMEDVLDEFMVRVPCNIHRHTLSKFAHEFYHFIPNRKAFNEMSDKMNEIKRKMNNIMALKNNFEEGSSSSAGVEDCVTHQSLEEDEIIGFEEHKKDLIHQLVNEESSHMKISVVGPGGSGKSILVKNVYESKEVLGKFDCHAWIHVSHRSFNIDEHLWSILKQFCEGREESILPGVDVRAKLKNYLQQKRYVVVLDDVWRPEDLECIVSALPNDYGGRIIFTTRKSDLASSCVYIHELNGLPWKEAWKLFCRKAFRTSNGQCPQELLEWSQKIVKRCEGLPLAIVAVGSLLSNKEQIPIEWKKLHDSLGSEIGTNSTLSIISRILLPSYKDLSSNLKSCFLYFSIFPEDYSIKRGRLIRLWLAEGFVKKKRGKTLEEVAEDYLNELIGRNLVHANTRDFDRRVSSCRVLNLVREFIILKAEEENFFAILTEPRTSLSEKVRRLSIDYACTKLQRGLTCVRTSFMFGWDRSFCSKIGTLLHDFQLLRVLDLQGAELQDFPKEIIKLILLRYLSLRQTNIGTVPDSIKKLSYLETLDLKHTSVTKLPVEIFRLQFLCHLLVCCSNVMKNVTCDSVQGVEDSVQGVEVSAGIGALSAIQKLTLIKVNKHRGIIEELGDLTKLRKLGLVGLKTEDGKKLRASIQNMQDLSTLDVSSTSKSDFLDLDEMVPPRHLQRLYLKGCLQKLPGWIATLDSLVRIRLKWSKLDAKESPLVTLQALPNLMELEMVEYYTGEELEFNAATFKKLKILHLEQFDRLNTVVVEQGAMPELKKLTIRKCENLKMLPLGISDLTKLEELLLYDMHRDFISRLEKNSEDRYMVDHIGLIHSFSRVGMNQSFSLQNLSRFYLQYGIFYIRKQTW